MFLSRATRLPCTGDDAIALFAAYQFGLVSATQARRSGLGSSSVDVRLRRGEWLSTLHHGVFHVAGFGAPSWCPRRAVMAAVLAVAHGAFACRETAAWLWRLDGARQDRNDVVHVGVRSRSSVSPLFSADLVRGGVRVHVVPITVNDLACRPPFSLTSARRTLDDLARCADGATVARMRASAVRQRLIPSATVPLPRGRASSTAAARRWHLPV